MIKWLYNFRNNPKKISKFVSIQKKNSIQFWGKTEDFVDSNAQI